MIVKTSSRKLIFPALLVVLGFCLLAAGCTSSSSDTPTPQVTAGATAAPAPGTTSSGGVPGSVTAVSYTALIPFLPGAPAGWTADDPAGFTMTDQGSQWTWAGRDYEKGDASATVLIQDSAYYDVGYWQSWDSLVSFESTEGYYKQKTVGGYPAWEVFSRPDSYGTWVGVNDRFMVYVSVDGGSKQDLDAFVNAINYGGLANLK